MKNYRLYLLDSEGRIARIAEKRFDDDGAATAWARGLAHDRGKELWQGGRLVVCFTASGAAWLPPRPAPGAQDAS